MAITASAVFLLTLILVIWQPRRLGIGWAALGGAALDLALGVIKPANILTVTGIVWDATLTFVALIVISLILDDAGFFRWAAFHMGRLARGDGRRALVYIMLLGTLVSAFFANDGTALILTPIVYEMVLVLELDQRGVLAFIMACGFIADTTSLPLVISNLVNIVSADFFHLDFISYAGVMLVPDLAALAATLAAVFWYYRRHIPATYSPGKLPEPASAIRAPWLFKASWYVLGAVLAGYLVGALLHLPVSLITWAGALALLAGTRRDKTVNPWRVLKSAPWQVVIFSIGMYLVVFGLRDAGLTAGLTTGLAALARHGLFYGVIGTGALVALLSAVMNNMPAVMVGALSIAPVHAPALVRHGLIFANVVGADLGPKLTPLGSLATLLWLHVLSVRGLKITWADYLKVGLTLTPFILLVTLLALAGWLAVAGNWVLR